MKNKKAINAIKEDNCYGCYGSKEDCEMCAYGVAIDALERQEPKEPLHFEQPLVVDEEFVGVWEYDCCPVCGTEVREEYDTCCNNCGQALKWSDKDDK